MNKIYVYLYTYFEISKKNNNGVLGRPWTKWKVLRVISNTLKFPKT
jgi:hypothetical protein